MRPSLKVSVTAGCLAVALGLAGARAADACSICRCGDPAFAALGLDLFNPGRFNLALDWDRFEKEQGSGEHDPDTGGQMLYATPRLLIRLSPALVARASAQIPVAESLNGEQDEHTVWNAGITWTFGR